MRKIIIHLNLFLVAILVAPVMVPNTGNAAKVNEQFDVSGTVKYKDIRYSDSKKNQAVRVLEVNTKDPYTHVEVALPSTLNGMKTTTTFARDNNRDRHAVLGAINGPFFHMHGPSYQLGMPMNLIATNDQIFQAGEVFGSKSNYVNEPIAFGVDAKGKNTIDYFQFDMNYIHNDKKYSITSTNKVREANNTILYTSHFPKKTTETNEWGTEVVVESSAPTLKFNSTVTGKVVSIRHKQDKTKTVIPKNGFVLSGNGVGSDNLEKINIGDSITLEMNIDQKWQNASFMLASGPMLVKGGKVSITMDPQSPNARGRAPRTAVAIDKTGEKVFFITVDGRQPGYSNGMTIPEFAKFIADLGVDRALNLDGGGSTAMAVRKPGAKQVSLVNRPSDGWERSVPAALMAVSTQVFPDVRSTHWALEQIVYLVDRGTINGFPDGTFRPEASITREQAAVMLARDFKLDTKNVADPGFKDVKKTSYAYGSIAAVAEAGYFIGKGNNNFGVNDTLTRAEMAVLLQRAFEIAKTDKSHFPDIKGHWAYDSINAIAEQKITTGYPDGTYKPNENVSRSQFSAFLVRAQK